MPTPPVTAPAAPGPLPATRSAAAPDGPREIVDLRRPRTVPARPLPPVGAYEPPTMARTVVRGVRCGHGHFNHPSSSRCARCGEVIEERSPASGTRPPLGVLVAEGGPTYRLDRPYAIGPGADRDPSVTGGRARALLVSDHRADGAAWDAAIRAATWAELRLTDWQVVAIDHGAAPGTFMRRAGDEPWVRLVPYRGEVLAPHTELRFGTTQFTFVSPWPHTT